MSSGVAEIELCLLALFLSFRKRLLFFLKQNVSLWRARSVVPTTNWSTKRMVPPVCVERIVEPPKQRLFHKASLQRTANE